MSKLRYSLATNPSPPLASPDTGAQNTIDLTIYGTNPTSQRVQITSVAITIPYGDSAADLTPAPFLAPTAPDGWTVSLTNVPDSGSGDDSPSGNLTITFTSIDSAGVTVTGTALAFQFLGLTVNQQPGSVAPVIVENGNTPGMPPLFIPKFSGNWGAIHFGGDTTLNYGEGVSLNWSGPATATYQLTYYTPELSVVNVPAGNKALPAIGTYPSPTYPPVLLTETTTFYLLVTDQTDTTQNVQLQWTVTVTSPPPQILAFTADLALNPDGRTWTVTFAWTTLNAFSVSIAGVASGLKPESTCYAVQATLDTLQTSYTLTATIGTQSVQETVTLSFGHFATISVANSTASSGNLHTVAAVMSDARVMAVACDTGVFIFQCDSYTSASGFQVLGFPNETVADLAFAANDTVLFILTNTTNGNAGKLYAYETSSWSQICATGSLAIPCTSMAVAADGSWIVLQLGTANLNYVLSFANDALTTIALKSATANSRTKALATTPDGANLIFLAFNGDTNEWLNQEYSVALNNASAPFTLVGPYGSIPYGPPNFNVSDSAWYRTYPNGTAMLVIIYNPSSGTTMTVYDSQSFTPLTGSIPVTWNVGGPPSSPLGAIGATAGSIPIFYAVTTTSEFTANIGVFGPLAYQPTSSGS